MMHLFNFHCYKKYQGETILKKTLIFIHELRDLSANSSGLISLQVKQERMSNEWKPVAGAAHGSQEAKKESICVLGASSCFPFLFILCIPAYLMVSLTFRANPLILVHCFGIHPYRHTQKCNFLVYQMVLSPIRLTQLTTTNGHVITSQSWYEEQVSSEQTFRQYLTQKYMDWCPLCTLFTKDMTLI